MEYDTTTSCLVFDDQTLNHEQMPVTWAKQWHVLLFKKKC